MDDGPEGWAWGDPSTEQCALELPSAWELETGSVRPQVRLGKGPWGASDARHSTDTTSARVGPSSFWRRDSGSGLF